MTKIKKVIFEIKEKGNYWEVYWPGDFTTIHETAIEAQKAALEYSEVLTRAGVSSILIIEWQPVSSIGRSVVKAIQ